MFSVTDEPYLKRYETCLACPHMHTRDGARRCKLSGGFIGCMVRVPSEECPVGKWKAEAATLTVSGRTVETLQDGTN